MSERLLLLYIAAALFGGGLGFLVANVLLKRYSLVMRVALAIAYAVVAVALVRRYI